MGFKPRATSASAGLRFENLRKPLALDVVPDVVRAQVEAITRDGGESMEQARVSGEYASMELVDVVDAASGGVRYQLYLYGYGSGHLFEHGTTTVIGTIAQHGFELDDLDLCNRLWRAYLASDGLSHTILHADDGYLPALPAKLPAVDWSALKSFRGPATAVRGWVRRLATDDPHRLNDAYERLDQAVVGDGKWCSAASATLELLFMQLPKVRTEIGVVLMLIADIIGAPHKRSLSRRGPRPTKKLLAVVERHLPSLRALTRAKDSNARAGFAQVAATVPELGHQTISTLVLLTRDPESTVRMSALLALGALGGTDAVAAINACARDDDPGVRGAAAVADIAAQEDASIAERATALQGWLSFRRPRWTANGPQFLWFPLGPETDVLGPLLELAERRGQESQLLGALLDSPNAPPKRVSELIITIGGFARDYSPDRYTGYVALPEELTASQRELAHRLAASELLPVGAYGLPACGAPRRRWLGLEPPGPSDRAVELTVEGRSFSGPLWRVWQEMIRAGVSEWGTLPPALATGLGDLDRWHVLVDKAARSYGGDSIDYESVYPELERVSSANGLLERATAIAADLAVRYRAARGYGWLLGRASSAGRYVYDRMDAQGAALLLLPFARAERTWPVEWDVLLPSDDNDLSRAVAEALPSDRRRAWARSLG